MEPHTDFDTRQPQRRVEIYPDDDALCLAGAARVVALARTAIAEHGRFSFAMAGGSTPRPLYALLATPSFAVQVDWSRVHVFWGDERCVPPDHPDSNYRMVREALLDRVPIPAHQVHRIVGEDEPDAAAWAYEHLLRAFFGLDAGPPEHSFDLALLGMGDDGHTASLFPGTPPVLETRRWVLPNRGPRATRRVTLTPVVLNAADAVVFLVAGASKAGRLGEVLEGSAHTAPLPIERIRPIHAPATWMVDTAAATNVKTGERK